jgi:hypothetical protein
MAGTILDFKLDERSGVLLCDQGNRYHFALAEWRSNDLPQVGERVDFVPGPYQNATQLYRLASNPAPAPGSPTQPPPSTNAQAIISLVFGICGLMFFGSLIAVICGHIARGQIRDSQGRETGDGLAVAGLVLGYIGLGLTLLFIAIVMVVIAAGASL